MRHDSLQDRNLEARVGLPVWTCEVEVASGRWRPVTVTAEVERRGKEGEKIHRRKGLELGHSPGVVQSSPFESQHY